MYIVENIFEDEFPFSQERCEDPIDTVQNDIEREEPQKKDFDPPNSPKQKSAKEPPFEPQKVAIVEEEIVMSANKKIVINSFFILNFESLL